jgi:hypothetical protein
LIVFLSVSLGSCDFSQTPPISSERDNRSVAGSMTSKAAPVFTSTAGAEEAPSFEVSTATSQPSPPPRQLTAGGCCVLPFWGPDSAAVYFLDRPNGGPIGTYRVDLQGNPPSLVEPGAAVFSSDLNWMTTQVGGAIEVLDRMSGDTWKVPSQGRMVSFSPQADWVTWQIQSSNVANLDRRRWTLMVGSLSSRETSSPLTGIGGGFIGWGRSETALLFSGRQEMGGKAGLWRSALDGSDAALLFSAERIRSPQVSPQGGWVALTIAFSGDQSQDGLWLVSTRGQKSFRVPQFGAYRWRGEGSLLVIPLDNGRTAIRLIQVNAYDGQVKELKLPPHAIDAIVNNTWEVSPDGKWLVFQSATDGNLWLIRLPSGIEGP